MERIRGTVPPGRESFPFRVSLTVCSGDPWDGMPSSKEHTMWKWLLVVLAIPALILTMRSPASADGAISPAQAAALIKDKKDLQLIDVRTADEYAEGHLAKAKLIPLQELEQRLAEIDKSKPVLLYCRSGHRSGNALKILQGKGFADAKHIEGGIGAWQAAGLPVTR
jgi:rhodanese-related sulfurtransferase